MAQPPRVAEALALFLSRAGMSALASSSSATRRAAARAAVCSSAAGPSSDYWALAVFSSDAVLAALRTSIASASLRAFFHAAASPSKGAPPHVLLLPPPRASEPALLLSTDTVAGASDLSASSSSTSLWQCLAGGWYTSELVFAAVRPNPAAASRIGLQFWANGISYSLGFPVTGQGRSSAIFLLPEAASPPRPPFSSFSEVIGPWMRQGYRSHGFNRASLSSVAHYTTSSRPHESFSLPPPVQSVDNLIFLMNEMTFNEEDTLKFKQAFSAKFQTLKNVDDLIFVMNEMTFDDEGKVKFKQAFYEKFRTLKWLCILKVITLKTGPHKEAMDLQIKEGLSYSEELEAEFTNDAAKARTEVKLDMLLKGQQELRADSKKILGFWVAHDKMMDWGTFILLGRKFDVTKLAGLFKLFGF